MEARGPGLSRGEDLPPVKLYKLGDAYFVLDGNLLLSVARYHGIGWIDAEVTQLFTRRHGESSGSKEDTRGPTNSPGELTAGALQVAT